MYQIQGARKDWYETKTGLPFINSAAILAYDVERDSNLALDCYPPGGFKTSGRVMIMVTLSLHHLHRLLEALVLEAPLNNWVRGRLAPDMSGSRYWKRRLHAARLRRLVDKR